MLVDVLEANICCSIYSFIGQSQIMLDVGVETHPNKGIEKKIGTN